MSYFPTQLTFQSNGIFEALSSNPVLVQLQTKEDFEQLKRSLTQPCTIQVDVQLMSDMMFPCSVLYTTEVQGWNKTVKIYPIWSIVQTLENAVNFFKSTDIGVSNK